MVRDRGERPTSAVPPAAPARPAAVLPIDWMKLDAQEREEHLRILAVWVPAIVVSYELADKVVPACWYLHEAMIHELLALFQYRNQQQFNLELGPPPSAPLDFQYQFSLWVTRMRSLVGDAGCTTNEHEPQRPTSWADKSNPLSAKWLVALEEHLDTLSGGAASPNVGGSADNQIEMENRE